jgi:2-succinyl-5-enolpyruvyl-6-hydroxy-3-cyclohexene-1-carboxylate synthase
MGRDRAQGPAHVERTWGDAVTAPNSQHLWAQVLIQELVRAGVRHAVVCPGSRSTPLAFAVADAPGVKLWTMPDERSAAFLALGLGMSTEVPAAVVVTSGTAGANCYPAFIEAHVARVPLIILTADRPWELHGFGALQTMDQARLFGAYGTHTGLMAPEMTNTALVHLRAVVSRAAQDCRRQRLPCHINVPFREPLAPSPEPLPTTLDALALHGRKDAPFHHVTTATATWDPPALAAAAHTLATAQRGLVVAGPRLARNDGYQDAILELAEHLGFPVLAEATSNLRFHPRSTSVISHAEAILRTPGLDVALCPDVILRVGGPITTRKLQAFVDGAQAAVVSLADEGMFFDPNHTAQHVLQGNAPGAARAFQQAIPQRKTTAYEQRWQQLDRAVANAWVDTSRPSSTLTEPQIAALVASVLPAGSALFVSSSMPIRDLDAFSHARRVDVDVYASRGVSGIDGITSTAFGVAAGSGRPTVLLTGDTAFLHDVGGLVWGSRLHIPLTVVLVNNDGGRIFSFLPVADHGKHLDRLFTMPHGADLSHASALAGIAHHRPTTLAELRRDVLASLQGGTQVIEARVDGARVRADHDDLWSRARNAVAGCP